MSCHPSLFELSAFVRWGETSPEFEVHVSGCEQCAARLSVAASRTSPPALFETASSSLTVETRWQFAVVALIACVTVLVARSAPLATLPVELSPPEGVHGVATASTMFVSSSERFDDGGAADSGWR